MGNLVDLVGRKFGRLTVTGRAGNDGHGHAMWACLCECGTTITVARGALRTRETQSCGCLKRQRTRETHTTHGQSNSPEWRAWRNMRQRCKNRRHPKYRDYGGRGITVCDRWASFENFLADMGPKPSPAHSIDRIDVNGNYEPGNCRWATPKEQRLNQRPR